MLSILASFRAMIFNSKWLRFLILDSCVPKRYSLHLIDTHPYQVADPIGANHTALQAMKKNSMTLGRFLYVEDITKQTFLRLSDSEPFRTYRTETVDFPCFFQVFVFFGVSMLGKFQVLAPPLALDVWCCSWECWGAKPHKSLGSERSCHVHGWVTYGWEIQTFH